ncbi:MAG: cysteine synthase family protein [Desulfurococcales archaeon]|nr:cysteine synthase family protein [Desulfurococcales archaeon]
MLRVLDVIGSTPLVELRRLVPSNSARVLVKLEYMNPTGSHKDRVAFYMIKDAEERGLLRPGSVVVEASSGNTGVSVAFVSRYLGYRAIVVIPKGTSKDKVFLIKVLGAEVVEGSDDPESPNYYVRLAEELAHKYGGVFLNQYENIANIRAHYETTGPEIWRDTGGSIDAFVMGVGTGGTITGVGRYLKERKSDVLIVAVTPKGSPLAGGKVGDRIEGLLYSDYPKLLDRSVVDKVIEVSLEDALRTCIKLAREEGILAGPSTGANIYAALMVARELGHGKTVVTLAADSILKYSTLLATQTKTI